MLEYILSKFIKNNKYLKISFLFLMVDGTRKEGKLVSVSNGVIIVEKSKGSKITNEFLIVNMVAAVEVAINIKESDESSVKQEINNLIKELYSYDNGACPSSKLINCIKESEKHCILTRYFLLTNHVLEVLVEDYINAYSEVSIYKSSYISQQDIRLNLLFISNSTINSITIPESCEKIEQGFNCFKYIKY